MPFINSIIQAKDERNYHVFYELLAGVGMDQKEKLGLQSASKYFYLNQGGSSEIESKYDHEDFMSLLQAMDVLKFCSEDKAIIFKVLASILHLGNICFKKKSGKSTESPFLYRHQSQGRQKDNSVRQNADDGAVELASTAEIKWVAYLLGLSDAGLSKVLTFKTTTTSSDKVYTPYNIDQALDTRDAIAKALYTSLFTWLVEKVNLVIGQTQSPTSISILDIFGFENFCRNSFEQLCINFANETLQLFFNKHVFKLEQEEYKSERISWSVIGFKDNQAVIDTISKKPLGILHLLDDESNFPKGTDYSFLEKCHYHHGSKMCYSKPKMSHSEFVITHYAGDVAYDVTNFLEKNRDSFQSDVASLLMSSKHKLIPKIFGARRNAMDQPSLYDNHFRVQRLQNIRPRIATVGAKFNDSLSQLMETMGSCHPWFIRCIKPNHDKIPLKFDMRIVLQQLRSTGMLETIRIRKLGYPINYKFPAFLGRYRCLAPRKRAMHPKEECEHILSHTGKGYHEHYQVGASMIFMRSALETHLETWRTETLNRSADLLQKSIRRYLAKKRFLTMKESAEKIQSHYRGYCQRRQFQAWKRAAVKIQAQWRMILQLRRYRQAILVAARLRKERENNFQAIKNELPKQVKDLMREFRDQSHGENIGLYSTNTAPIIAMEIEECTTMDGNAEDYMRFVEQNFDEGKLQSVDKMLRKPVLRDKSLEGYQNSIAICKQVLLYSKGNLSSMERYILGNHIASYGIKSDELRDEILAQLCNLTHPKNIPAMDKQMRMKLWELLCACLSSFPPSSTHSRYILNYCQKSENNPYSGACKKKVNQCLQNSALQRRQTGTSLLEWSALESQTAMALTLHCCDEKVFTVEVESWTTAESAAFAVLKSRGVTELAGWSIGLKNGNGQVDINGDGFIFDLLGQTEYPNSAMFNSCNPDCPVLHKHRHQEGHYVNNTRIIHNTSEQQSRENEEMPLRNIPLPEYEKMNDVSDFLDKVFDEALDYQFLESEADVKAMAHSIKGVNDAEPAKSATLESPLMEPVNSTYRQQLQNVYYNQLMQIIQLHSLQNKTLQTVQHNVFGKAVSQVLGDTEGNPAAVLPGLEQLQQKMAER